MGGKVMKIEGLG